jgi:hypothetical protein
VSVQALTVEVPLMDRRKRIHIRGRLRVLVAAAHQRTMRSNGSGILGKSGGHVSSDTERLRLDAKPTEFDTVSGSIPCVRNAKILDFAG